MSPEFVAYKKFISIRSHFTLLDYDYFFYKGKTRTNSESFKSNKNYNQFVTLSKRAPGEAIVPYIASNFANQRKKTIWITDLLTPEANQIYLDHVKYEDASGYYFDEDLKKLKDVPASFEIENGSYPKIMVNVLAKDIRLETLCILDVLYEGKILEYMTAKINENYLWPTFRMKIIKFKPFIYFNSEKLQIILDKHLQTK